MAYISATQPYEYKWPRGGNLYTGFESAPRSMPLTGLGGGCAPCGALRGFGALGEAIPNLNRDGVQACRDGAPVGFVAPITRFSRKQGSRDILAIISVACPEVDGSGRRWVREVALPIWWVAANIDAIPLEQGTNRTYLMRVLEWAESRGQALTMQQIREELAQADSQARQTAEDNARAARQEPAVGREQVAARGHDETAAQRQRRERYETDAWRVGVADVWAAAARNVVLARDVGWAPIASVYAGGAGDPQLVIDAAIFQAWLKAAGRVYAAGAITVDGKVGPITADSIKNARRAQMAGTLQGDVPRLMLSLAVAGLEDPLTAPALPVDERPVPRETPVVRVASGRGQSHLEQVNTVMRNHGRFGFRAGDLVIRQQPASSGGGALLLLALVAAGVMAKKG